MNKVLKLFCGLLYEIIINEALIIMFFFFFFNFFYSLVLGLIYDSNRCYVS